MDRIMGWLVCGSGSHTGDFENRCMVLRTDVVSDGAGVIPTVSGRYGTDLQYGRETKSCCGDTHHRRVFTSVESPTELDRSIAFTHNATGLDVGARCVVFILTEAER